MSVQLRLKNKFVTELHGYQPSDDSLKVLHRIPLVIMLGVTASGRNTIINHLVNSGSYHFVISDTTRPPKVRDGMLEQDGVQYNFRTEEDVLDDIVSGNYLEAELIHDQQVSGISIHELERAAASGKIPINEVDIGGTVAIKRAKPDTKFFFIIPPSYKEWLYRLHGREIISVEETSNRMKTAIRVLSSALDDDTFTFIVNDSSHASSELINNVVMAKHNDYNDKSARDVAKNILMALTSSAH